MMFQELMAEINLWVLVILAVLFVMFMRRQRRSAAQDGSKRVVLGKGRSTTGN